MEHGRGVRREPQSSSIPTPRCNQGSNTSSMRNLFSQWYDGLIIGDFPIPEMHLGRFLDIEGQSLAV